MRIKVRGSSMRPTLADGAEIDVRPSDGSDARVGDVVLVLQTMPGSAAAPMTVLHRVVAASANTVWTQGDGSGVADDPVPRTRIIGIAALPSHPVKARLRGIAGRLRRLRS